MGAFAYYRHLVENQKGRIIGEIGKVAKRLGASEGVLQDFERAQSETQFSKAINEMNQPDTEGEDAESKIRRLLKIAGFPPGTVPRGHNGPANHCPVTARQSESCN
jgi:hypothetical protein